MSTGPEGALRSAGLLSSGQYGGKAVLSQEEGKSFQHPSAILFMIGRIIFLKMEKSGCGGFFFYFLCLFFECTGIFKKNNYTLSMNFSFSLEAKM